VSTAALLLVGACGARSALDLPPGDSPGGVNGNDAGVDGTMLPDGGGSVTFNCAEAGVTYIYVIGTDNLLYSFYPTTGELTPVGVIDCNDPFGATPFSMAVDHQGVAYVEFGSGLLYRVSTKTAECEPTPFVQNQQGFSTTFGMGFVASDAGGGGSTEVLYVASSPPTDAGDVPSQLARIDVTTFDLENLGTIGLAGGMPVHEPELTSTGGGKLYGFFAPSAGAPPSFIVEINPGTLAVESNVLLPDVVEGQGWAFGFWGGDFYMLTAPDDVTSIITRYRPSDGSIVQVATAPLGVLLVGAGVSTCAPQQ